MIYHGKTKDYTHCHIKKTIEIVENHIAILIIIV